MTKTFTPSRRAAMVGGGAALAAVASAALDGAAAAATDSNPWAPTELGKAVLQAAPEYWHATIARCYVCDGLSWPEYDPELVAEADDLENSTRDAMQEAIDAIVERPITEPAHLTDLAIAFCAWEFEDTLNGAEQCEPIVAALISGILEKSGVEIQRPWGEAISLIEAAQREGVEHV